MFKFENNFLFYFYMRRSSKNQSQINLIANKHKLRVLNNILFVFFYKSIQNIFPKLRKLHVIWENQYFLNEQKLLSQGILFFSYFFYNQRLENLLVVIKYFWNISLKKPIGMCYLNNFWEFKLVILKSFFRYFLFNIFKQRLIK